MTKEWATLLELNAALDILATRRRGLLAGASNVETTGGRVLICEFNGSVASGESEEETNGFFDVFDRPPWDTWMFAVQRTSGASASSEPLAVLVSWVPAAFVASVDGGIRVNPYDCIYWASQADLEELDLC